MQKQLMVSGEFVARATTTARRNPPPIPKPKKKWAACCKECGWQNTRGFHADDEVDAGIKANLEHQAHARQANLGQESCPALTAPILIPLYQTANPLKDVAWQPVVEVETIVMAEKKTEKVHRIVSTVIETRCFPRELEIVDDPQYDFFCYIHYHSPDSLNSFLPDTSIPISQFPSILSKKG